MPLRGYRNRAVGHGSYRDERLAQAQLSGRDHVRPPTDDHSALQREGYGKGEETVKKHPQGAEHTEPTSSRSQNATIDNSYCVDWMISTLLRIFIS